MDRRLGIGVKERVRQRHGASLHTSGEDYLEVVLILQKERRTVRSADVARRFRVSKSSASHAVTTLKESGFFTTDEDFSLRLVDVGREVAE